MSYFEQLCEAQSSPKIWTPLDLNQIPYFYNVFEAK